MSFQDEYKITNADRLDKGVYGLPDTPGMTTAAIQERFDSLGNLAIDKFNALVEAASDVVDGSDTKFPTNKAVQDYISGEGGAIIDDTTPSLHKAYSSQKVENMFGDVASRVIDDTEPLSNKTYSSEEIEEKLSNIPSPESIIDDDTASADTTYSSSKLESDFISVSDTEEQTATDEFTTINGGLLSECKVALSPNQDLHGYDSPWVGGAGKNKLPLVLADIKSNNTQGTWSGNSYTYNGVTFTVNTDSDENVTGIETSGTASGNGSFYLCNGLTLDSGYILNGCPSTGGSSTYRIRLRYGSSDYFVDTGSGAGITSPVTSYGSIDIRFNSGTNLSGLTFYPMIRLSSVVDDSFAPYTNICPISGHTQVEVENEGKNLFDPTDIISGKRLTNITGTAYNSTQDVIDESNSFVSSLIKVTQGNIVTKNSPSEDAYHRWHIYDSNGICVRYTSDNVITIGSGESYVALCGANSEINTTLIRQGYQVTVNLGGTYYSGTLDVVSGVFVATQKSIGASDFDTFVTNPSAGGLYYAQIDTSGSKANGNGICNMAKVDNLNAWIYTYPVAQIAPSQAGRIRFYCESTSMNEFLSQYANLQIVFELDTPLTIQLSPTMVKALVGENHLSAPLEGQEITESVYSPLAKWNAVIDDTTASNDTTYSSNKINTIVPKIDDTTASASKVFSSLKTANLITELSERFDFSTTEKPLGWWTDGKVYYGKVINIMGCPKEMFGLMVDLDVEVDTFIGIFAVGNAKDDNYNGGYCMGGTIYCKVIKSEGQNTQIQPACAVMALGGASLLVLYTKVE